MSPKQERIATIFYRRDPSYFEDRVDGICTMSRQEAQEKNTAEWQAAVQEAIKRRSHYDFLDHNFDTVLTRMGQEEKIKFRGDFSASGDKYYSYRERWEEAGIPFFHGAVMYHLMELLYYKEVRETPNGWVHPADWVIANYKAGRNLALYMEGLE